MSLRRVKPDSLLPRRKTSIAPSRAARLLPRGGVAGSARSWPSMRDFDQCTAPNPIGEQRERDREAQEQVVQAHGADVVGMDREDDVGDDRPARVPTMEMRNSPGDAALLLPLLDRVEVADARAVRREAGVLDPVGLDHGGARGRRVVAVLLERRAGVLSRPASSCSAMLKPPSAPSALPLVRPRSQPHRDAPRSRRARRSR